MAHDAAQRALALFNAHANCAQSVFAACAVNSSLTEAQHLALAAAFGGGMARTGETCGALTGALLALGELHSAEMAADHATGRAKVYAEAAALIDEFRSQHGSILCHELTGCRLNTTEGHDQFVASGARENVCRKLVVNAVEMVETRRQA
jgi:C_GCAxxG_C_C family probable redox protein